MPAPIGIKLRKDNFFDRQAVIEAVGKVEANNLSKGGSFIRQTARRSMRTRVKPSAPGTPPSAHSVAHQAKAGVAKRGPLLKDKLYFQFDRSSKSVVVGPERLKGSKNSVPEIHEYGGFITLRKRVYKKKKKGKPATEKQKRALALLRRAGLLPKRPFEYRNVLAKFPKRPYMDPAFRKELQAGKLIGVWADSVKG